MTRMDLAPAFRKGNKIGNQSDSGVNGARYRKAN